MEKKWFKVFEIIALAAIITLIVIYFVVGNEQDSTNTIPSIIMNDKEKKFYGIVDEKGNDFIVVKPDYNSDFRKKTDSLKVNVNNVDVINQNDRVKVIYKENEENSKTINLVKIEQLKDDKMLEEKNSKYSLLQDISMEYNDETAEKDGCYIIDKDKEVNEILLSNFESNVKDKKDSYIRVVQKTLEDKLIIIDVEYINNIFLVSIDTRRDVSRIEEERKIYNYTYKNINSYEDVPGRYVYLYNGNQKVTKDNVNELDCLLLGF